MSNSPVLRRNSIRRPSRVKSIGKARLCLWLGLWLACFWVAWLSGAPAQAAITTTKFGVSPFYMGSDPWFVGGRLSVGRAPAFFGRMTVDGGSDVDDTEGSIGGNGGVTIKGLGSSWTNSGSLYVGEYGSGTLTVQQGGSVSNSYGRIGYESGSDGTVTIDGGSSWTNSSGLYVGYKGSGELTVQNDGSVSNTDGYVGYHGCYSTGTVTVDGSSWSNSEDLYVGWRGDGALTVKNSGSVSNTYGYIGYYSGELTHGTGIVTVDDSSWTDRAELSVGHYGSGTLVVRNGGSVSNTTGKIGWSSYYGYGPDGTVTVDGTDSSWTNSEDLYVGYHGPGTLTITDGGLVSVAETLTIDSLAHDDSFINMSTGGMLALYGEADDSLTAFLNLISGTDAINYWDTTISDWDDITGATRDIDYTLDYIDDVSKALYGYTLLTVETVSTFTADFDFDGDVDGSDFLAWQRGGSPRPSSAGDLGLWEDQFGTIEAPSMSTAVPEPDSLVLLLAAAIFGLRAKGQSNRSLFTVAGKYVG